MFRVVYKSRQPGEVYRFPCPVWPATFIASRVKISQGDGPTTVYFSQNSSYLKT